MADDVKDQESKMFSQDDVNRIMAENKRSLQAENVGLKDEIGKLSKQWEEFQTMLAEVAGSDTGSDDAGSDDDFKTASAEDEVTKRLAWLQKKHQQEIDSLRSTIESEKKLRLDAESRRLITERDAQLQEALASNDVVSIEGGMKFFRDNLFHDEEAGQWKYRAKDGLTFNIKDGISEELPDWLKKPSTSKGGSGSQAALVNEIDTKALGVKSAQERATRTGDPNDIAVFQRKKRELDALKDQVAVGGRR